ncbi:MAG: hypothetical protein ACI9ZT_001886 [Gammaproteobacteria bacterium]|jgi:hypothetical protein
MRIIKAVPFILLLGYSSVVTANDFPTAERVEYVLNCLQDMGRNEMDDLQTCSCRIDSIASNMSFETYSYAVTYDRNKRMTGEKGGVFRDNKAGKSFSKELVAAEEIAGGQCKQVVHIVAPTDLTKDEKYNQIEEIK